MKRVIKGAKALYERIEVTIAVIIIGGILAKTLLSYGKEDKWKQIYL